MEYSKRLKARVLGCNSKTCKFEKREDEKK